jgi:hypothetical protein
MQPCNKITSIYDLVLLTGKYRLWFLRISNFTKNSLLFPIILKRIFDTCQYLLTFDMKNGVTVQQFY